MLLYFLIFVKILLFLYFNILKGIIYIIFFFYWLRFICINEMISVIKRNLKGNFDFINFYFKRNIFFIKFVFLKLVRKIIRYFLVTS